MKKVLVLEDEANIRSFVVINLRRSGYEPIEADCGEMALEQLRRHPDTRVALLDVMLPDIDGFEVCRRIRASNSRIGIIMLTAKSQEIDKVTGLMTGADDYVTKPFSPAELTARVDALVRRLGTDEDGNANNELVSGPFVLNPRNVILAMFRKKESCGESFLVSRRDIAKELAVTALPVGVSSVVTNLTSIVDMWTIIA